MGDRAQIFVAEGLSAVRDDVGHATERRGPSVAAGLEKLDDVRFAPGSEAGEGIAAKIVGDKVVDNCAREILRTILVGQRLLFEPEPARGVARSAMFQALDEIGAAVAKRVVRSTAVALWTAGANIQRQ